MSAGGEISVFIALGAGAASFFTPCVLPLIPTYLGYLAGVSAGQILDNSGVDRKFIIINALAFVVGFSLVFTAFGLSASALGSLMVSHQELLKKISGLVIIFLGLNMAGVLKISFLLREKKAGYAPGKAGPFNSFLLGMAFSAGWTPCIGPILGSILLMASSTGNVFKGGLLLSVYSLGLAVPFILTAVFFSWFTGAFRKYSYILPRVMQVSGGLLVVLGIMIFTGFLNQI